MGVDEPWPDLNAREDPKTVWLGARAVIRDGRQHNGRRGRRFGRRNRGGGQTLLPFGGMAGSDPRALFRIVVACSIWAKCSIPVMAFPM